MGSDNLFSVPLVNIRPNLVAPPHHNNNESNMPIHQIYEAEEEAKLNELLNPRLSNARHDLEAINE